MVSLNKVQIIGNLGKDPEVRAIPSGAKVASFSIGTTERWTGKDGCTAHKTEWHNIVLWRGLAEIAEKYLRKGSQVYIEGKLSTRSWDDNDGQKRYVTEIIGDNLVMLGKAQESTPTKMQAAGVTADYKVSQAPQGEDDLPF